MIRALVFAGLVALGACASTGAQTASSENRACFTPREISNQQLIDDQHIKFTVRNVDYIVTVSGNASQLRYSQPLVMRLSGGGNQICTGNGLGLTLYVGQDPSIPLFVEQVERAPAQANG